MDKEICFIKIVELFMMEIGKMTKGKAMERVILQMDQNTKGIWKKI